MEIATNRLGKFALLAALTDEEEEKRLKASDRWRENGYKLAITVVSGLPYGAQLNSPRCAQISSPFHPHEFAQIP